LKLPLSYSNGDGANTPYSENSKRKQSIESLSWTDFFAQEFYLEEDVDGLHIIHHAYITPPTESGPLFVMHHGAGSSGLSFAVVAEEIRKILPNAGILSLDARQHGTTTVEPDMLDLRLETLARDFVAVIHQTQSKMGWESLPDLILVGHSLGGAVVTDVANSGILGSKVLGYAVLDVVEGI
jgi:protein phosphatase methylesterase 1